MDKRLLIRLLAPLLALTLGAGYWLLHRNNRDLPATPQPGSVLPPKTIAVIKFDESRHTIAVTTNKGTKTAFARKPEVRINEDKTVTVFTHSYGIIRKPFLGVGFSNTIRGYVGVSLLYWKRFDGSISLGITSDRRFNAVEPTISIGYLVYSNTSVNLGVVPLSYLPGQQPEVAAFVSLKF